MTVVLGWRFMTVADCDLCGPHFVLAGMRGGHLPQRLSPPAICIGYDYASAMDGLKAPPDLQPPPEHHITLAYRQRADDWPVMPNGAKADGVHNGAHLLPAAPQSFCTCGYYILFHPQDVLYATNSTSSSLFVYVVAVGKSIIHVRGARAERYRLLQWWVPYEAMIETEGIWRGPWGYSGAGEVQYTWRPVPLTRSIYPKGRSLPVQWGEVIERLTERYGMEPRLDNPVEADLPTGVFTGIPSAIAHLLSSLD